MTRRWHQGSVFGPGRRRRLDRNGRARFRYLLRAHTRARRLAPKHEWVGEALVKRLGADGQCDPSYDTLAEDAGCSARTARRATARMWELGLLLWQKRLIRTEWRAEQTSNAYELLTGDELLAPAAAPAISCGGQTGRETLKKELNLSVSEVARRLTGRHWDWEEEQAIAERSRDRQLRLYGRSGGAAGSHAEGVERLATQPA